MRYNKPIRVSENLRRDVKIIAAKHGHSAGRELEVAFYSSLTLGELGLLDAADPRTDEQREQDAAADDWREQVRDLRESLR